MSNNFGKIIDTQVSKLTQDELRQMLVTHGVIAFKKQTLTNIQYMEIMSAFGKIQNSDEQNVRIEYADPENNPVILMHNRDFLGASRDRWHIDHTFQGPRYLPIRAMYCHTVCDQGNETSFKDLKVLSNLLLEKFPEVNEAIAMYKMTKEGKLSFSVPVTWDCDYLNQRIVRYDSRIMEVNNDMPIDELKKFVAHIVETEKMPTFKFEWELGDLVIFDNNQALHRRSKLVGDIHHKRITTDHWLL
jgi:alpha-ketoglutarate-dependent taurine dioxygenase